MTTEKKRTPFIILLITIGILVMVIVFMLLRGPGYFANGSVLASFAGPGISHSSSSTAYNMSGTGNVPTSNQTTSQTGIIANTYLIKSFNISLAVANPMTSLNDIQSWITQTDLRAISNGMTIQNIDQKGAIVDITFSVQATLYPQIIQYLNGYAANHKGELLNSQESVQDVTSQYVDTQARVSSLQAELQRLHDLLAHAQSVSDIITIDQELTSLETQLNQTEAQLNSLSNQVTMYNVHISLSPLSAVVNPPSPASWNFLTIVQNAWQATVAFGQLLLTGFIWIVIFGVYIVPLLIIVLLVRRWQAKHVVKAT